MGGSDRQPEMPCITNTSRTSSTTAGGPLDSEHSSSPSSQNQRGELGTQFVKPSSKNHYHRSIAFIATLTCWTPPWLGILLVTMRVGLIPPRTGHGLTGLEGMEATMRTQVVVLPRCFHLGVNQYISAPLCEGTL